MRLFIGALALLFMSGMVSAEEASPIVIAGERLEVPVAPGFCAATDADMLQTGLVGVLGSDVVRRTIPLALHLDCASLQTFRKGGVPTELRAKYWGILWTAPESLHFNADHLATYEVMLQGLANTNARHLFGQNLLESARKQDFEPASIAIQVDQRAIGGTVQARARMLDRWFDIDLGIALLPVRSRLVLTAAVQSPAAAGSGANFAQAFQMLIEIRKPK